MYRNCRYLFVSIDKGSAEVWAVVVAQLVECGRFRHQMSTVRIQYSSKF